MDLKKDEILSTLDNFDDETFVKLMCSAFRTSNRGPQVERRIVKFISREGTKNAKLLRTVEDGGVGSSSRLYTSKKNNSTKQVVSVGVQTDGDFKQMMRIEGRKCFLKCLELQRAKVSEKTISILPE